MTDDATLADFGVGAAVDDADADSSSDTDDDDGSVDDPDDGSDGATAVEAERERDGDDRPNATLSTYAWGDYACSRCGSESGRVWRDGDAFVCPDCKEW